MSESNCAVSVTWARVGVPTNPNPGPSHLEGSNIIKHSLFCQANASSPGGQNNFTHVHSLKLGSRGLVVDHIEATAIPVNKGSSIA